MDFDRMLNYCAALEKNNDRAWFHENHAQYETAKGDFISLIEMLRFAIIDEAPSLSGDLMYMRGRDWMYRVARDMRYYKDRPPYEPSFRAYIAADRKSWEPIGYFLRIAPGKSCFGTGIWLPDTASVNIVRDYISENFSVFSEITGSCPIPVTGDRLKKMPRGYDESSPAAGWLKFKNWSLVADIPDAELTTFESLDRHIRGLVRGMEPFRLFMLSAARSGKTHRRALEEFYNA